METSTAKPIISKACPHIIVISNSILSNEKMILSEKIRRYYDEFRTSNIEKLKAECINLRKKYGVQSALDVIESLKMEKTGTHRSLFLEKFRQYIICYQAVYESLTGEINAKGKTLMKLGHLPLHDERSVFFEYIYVCEKYSELNDCGLETMRIAFMPSFKSWAKVDFAAHTGDGLLAAFDHREYSEMIDVIYALQNSAQNIVAPPLVKPEPTVIPPQAIPDVARLAEAVDRLSDCLTPSKMNDFQDNKLPLSASEQDDNSQKITSKLDITEQSRPLVEIVLDLNNRILRLTVNGEDRPTDGRTSDAILLIATLSRLDKRQVMKKDFDAKYPERRRHGKKQLRDMVGADIFPKIFNDQKGKVSLTEAINVIIK